MIRTSDIPLKFTFPAALLLLALSANTVSARASEAFPGPVTAQVVDIYDGDTVHVIARIWPRHEIDVRVRIRGIDAPEIRGRCKREKQAAYRARNHLRRLIGSQKLYLTNISGGKYYGRVLADIALQDGRDIASILLKSNLVRPYSRSRKASYCS